MSRHASLRTTALPYAYAGDGLKFELAGYSIDGTSPREFDIAAGQSYVNPFEDDEWERILLFARLLLPVDVIEQVFPDDERETPPAKLYLAVRCRETILREQVSVAESPAADKWIEVSFTLSKSDLRGEVDIVPYLVRTTDRSDGVSGRFATEANARVAGGQRYTLVVDDPDDDGSPAIDGEEMSFSEAEHLPDGGELYYLDFRNEARPKLWINADYPRVAGVLQSRGSVGAEPRMRDVVLDQVQYAVWTQLTVRAGCAVEEDGTTPYEWQETVVKMIAREMYDVNDETEAALALRRAVSDPEQLPEFTSRLDRELQRYIDPREQLINLMEEGLQI